MSEEIWKPVLGFEGLYEVSSCGRVRSLPRLVECVGPVKGRYLSRKPGTILRPGRMSGGHLSVVLGRDGGSRTVHSLVLAAFCGPTPPGQEIRHKDGNPANNKLSNLEYATRSRNGQDKKWHNGQKTYKLSPEEAREILLSLKHGTASGADLALAYGEAAIA